MRKGEDSPVLQEIRASVRVPQQQVPGYQHPAGSQWRLPGYRAGVLGAPCFALPLPVPRVPFQEWVACLVAQAVEFCEATTVAVVGCTVNGAGW